MSAIFGLVSLNGQPANRYNLDLMAAALAAHGPDGNGVWTGERVAMGQRLMCFTPEDRLERQPLVSAHGHHVLVTDGRVDNRPELAFALDITQAEVSEMPDSGFILRAYEKWGVDCCSHLIGDFVFALCDLRERLVLIARSPISNRTLYYYASPEILAFASAPKGLFALPWIPREIDQQYLADYLMLVPREPGRSFFAGLRELWTGEAILAGPAGLHFRKYWQPDLDRETRFARDSDYVDAFTAIFDRVIADHLRSLTPVGVMMSGGLDSSSVGATAAQLLLPEGKRIAAFTEVPRAGFELESNKQRYADETPLVRAVARKCGNMDLNLVRTDGCFLLDGIGECLGALEEPYRAATNRLWWEAILRQASCQNVRVVLTGLPGNLTVSQDGELLLQLIRRGRWIGALREAWATARQGDGSSVPWILARSGARLLPTPIWLAGERLLRIHNPVIHARPPWTAYSPVHPEFARAQRVEERARQNGHDFYYRVRGTNREDRYEFLRQWEPGLQTSRGYEALFGVQSRNPLADIRLVDFCFSLPEEQFQVNGMSRSLIRRAMKDRLPAEVLDNRRRGLQAADWFERANAYRPRMLAELARIERGGLAPMALDLTRIRSLVQEIPSSEARASIDFRNVIGLTFMMGSFLRWFESGMKWEDGDAAHA